MWAYLIIPYDKVKVENGVVTVLRFFAERKRESLKSLRDFWDTLFL